MYPQSDQHQKRRGLHKNLHMIYLGQVRESHCHRPMPTPHTLHDTTLAKRDFATLVVILVDVVVVVAVIYRF